METKHEILRMALAISWAWRASGKESHAGFHACMERFRGYAPEEVAEKVSRASLVGGTSPHIERLTALLEEVA